MQALPVRLVQDVAVDVDIVGVAAGEMMALMVAHTSWLLTAIELVGSPLSADHRITLSTKQGVS
jgi:hypothetical protein